MRIFLAGNDGRDTPKQYVTMKAPYILQTFYDLKDRDFEKVDTVVKSPKMFFLDSGAFTFMNSKKIVDWIKYADAYCDFINAHNCQYYFELDLDVIIGVEQTKKLTQHIENKTQKQCIPVFHRCRGMQMYRDMCKNWPYVAIGASGLTDECKWVNNKPVLKKMVDIAHEYGAQIHGLGYTRLSNINNTVVPFDSVDSSSALSGGRYATVYKFTGKKMICTRIKGQSKGYKVLNDHNIAEWIRLANYKDGKK